MTPPPSSLAASRSPRLALSRWISSCVFLGILASGCIGTPEARRGGAQSKQEAQLISDWSGPTAPQLVGRFQQSDDGLWFAWSGSAVTVHFQGTGLSVDVRDTGQNRFYVIVDGQLQPEKLVPGKGLHTLELASQLPPGRHSVTLYRLTEPLVGETQLVGLRLPPGASLLAPPAPRERRIEIIGDSISTGYGNEGKSAECAYSPSSQNHYQTYGAIAARELDADLVTVAWSGKGVSSNRGSTSDTILMPELWRRTLPERADSTWDFSAPAPQVVVINLGTNDFAPDVSDTDAFAPAYARFVGEVRERYPEAQILCALGPLLTDSDERTPLTSLRQALEAIVQERQAAGDTKVHLLEFAPVTEEEGFGCDWHPSQATHRRMATTLVERVNALLDWR